MTVQTDTLQGMDIKKVAVIGSGVMGAQIAAHFANAGVPTLLLDIVPSGADDRNALAAGAIAKMLKGSPKAFVHNAAAKRVTPGNLEDDFDQLSEVDWILEAIIEDPNIKSDLYKRIDAVRKDTTIVSSNTSTIPLSRLVQGLSDGFQQHFLVAHFFNPPRYMRLLELVVGPDTKPEVLSIVEKFADHRLGKGVVHCHDRPGFVANRIGIFWMQSGYAAALESDITIEEADAVMSRPVGIPKTGMFGLFDLIGIDLHPKIDASMASLLPAEDAYHQQRCDLTLINQLIENGYTGRKGKGGFYRLNRSGGGKVMEAKNLKTGDYAPVHKVALECLKAAKAEGLSGLLNHPDRGGQFAWRVLSNTLAYAASLVSEVADDIVAIDRAMTLGYAWNAGPFALIDQIGVADFVAKMKGEGRAVSDFLSLAAKAGSFYRNVDGSLQYLDVKGDYQNIPREDGVLLLEDIKRKSDPIISNQSASLWDIGDGVTCFEVHTKVNALDMNVMDLINQSIDVIPKNHKAMVIYNEASNFSVGADINAFVELIEQKNWREAEKVVAKGQSTFLAMKRSPFPVVAATFGMALGGGCETVLYANAIQAHVESYLGLVEAGVGLIPGWGGCTAMLVRNASNTRLPNGPMPIVTTTFETISTAKVSGSAFDAKDIGFLSPDDGITFNRDRLLADAKAKALELAANYEIPEVAEVTLPGPTGLAILTAAVRDFKARGLATKYDVVVCDALADVVSGGQTTDVMAPLTEEDLLALELKNFVGLMKNQGTLDRIQHMLKTGKPLRN
jgi:3-hydroxyacyl-CoA dehydrogenase